MNVKRWALLMALAAGLLWIVTGCGTQTNLLAQNAPTPTATRRPRPTFTPRPVDTDTPVPTDTPAATDTPEATDTPVPPTAKPVVKATSKPAPTKAPPTAIPPTQPPPPTQNPYAYRFAPWGNCNTTDPDICNVQNGVKCENSGNTRLNAVVYQDAGGDVSAGIKVRFSFAPDGAPIPPDELTGDNGLAQKTMSDQRGGNAGTYYAWVISSTGQRISQVSSPMVINTKPSGDPHVCIVATVMFVKN